MTRLYLLLNENIFFYLSWLVLEIGESLQVIQEPSDVKVQFF